MALMEDSVDLRMKADVEIANFCQVESIQHQ